MQVQQHRPDSPSESNLHLPDSLFNLQSQSNNMYNNIPDYSDHDVQKQQSVKMNGFSNYRTSATFTSFPNTNNRSRHPPTSANLSSNTYRDANAPFYPSSTDIFPSQITSPTLHSSHPISFDNRGQFDYSGPQLNGALKQSFGVSDPYAMSQLPQLNGSTKQSGSALGYPPQTQYVNGLHISSQTPYGPHVTSNGHNAGNIINGGPPGLAAPGNMSHSSGNVGPTNPSQEDISTIFVVGFPEDMQEREFQNMFTFSPGFEAATLKIPNKEYTAYGGSVTANTGSGSISMRVGPGALQTSYAQGFGGANDPYNIVTVNQGGVVVDGGRDGLVTSWPTSVPDDGNGQYMNGGGVNVPQRKQIIGFAKFRTRGEALEARDVLQGRRVDIEKGAVLKAEMAKKNLHTKRGVGPINASGVQVGNGGGGIGLAVGPDMIGMNGIAGLGVGVEGMSLRDREIGTLGAMGFGWRDHMNREDEDRDRERRREREREVGAINAMGLGVATRGPRERAEDDERERKRKELELRLRSTNSTAFDAFHSVPISRQTSNSNNGLGSVDGGLEHANSILTNGYGNMLSPYQVAEEVAGPWDSLPSLPSATLSTARPSSSSHPSSSHRSSSPPPPSSSSSQFSPPMPSGERGQRYNFSGSSELRRQPHDAQSNSSASSVVDGSLGSSVAQGEVNRALDGLAVSTSNGNTSPQLPSPASGASSGSARNVIDQNPPINTLYVGNLPTSPPPSGYPHDHLEESLRELFSARPGFRRLCFRQKNNGPMCFVEFEDVAYATKTLNDLYGHTLNGLIKGGGIRLSYSKNPLGVRTPTSAGSSGTTLQQQQQAPYSGDAFTGEQGRPPTILRRETDLSSPPPSSAPAYNGNYMMSAPPPRFSPSPSTGFTGGALSFLPRSANGVQGFSSFSPFGLSAPPAQGHDGPGLLAHEQPQSHHFSPSPANNIEAARAG